MTPSDVPPFDRDLFDLLVCPVSGAPCKWVEGRLVGTDAQSRRAYRVDGDIPVMIAEESVQLADEEWRRLMALPGPVGAGAAAVLARSAAAP